MIVGFHSRCRLAGFRRLLAEAILFGSPKPRTMRERIAESTLLS
jgi:hypothetical protein